MSALHEAAAKAGYAPLLEVSSKSNEKVGRHLSAFHLQVCSDLGEISLESAFQGSKVFERGGPYTDLYEADPRRAKSDMRLRESGELISFRFFGQDFPIYPKTAFYDWLYLNAVFPYQDWLRERLDGLAQYVGYTDIEFNPKKSINCQARSCALFVALTRAKLLDGTISEPRKFIQLMSKGSSKNNERIGLAPQFSF